MSDYRRGFQSCKSLYLAFDKYGLDNFTFVVLFHAFDKRDLDSLEKAFIKEYDSYRNGYNMTTGGQTPIMTPSRRARISKTLTGRKNPEHSENTEWAYRAWETRRKRKAEGKVYKAMKDVAKRGAERSDAQRALVQFPDGTKHVIKGIYQFAKEHGFNLRYFVDTLKYPNRSCKGYKILARLGRSHKKEKLLQGSTTISQESRVKRSETVPAPEHVIWSNDIVSSALKDAAAQNRAQPT